MTSRNEKIAAAIVASLKPGSATPWADIMAAVTGAGVSVTDWREVRNVLAALIKAGKCGRTRSITEECYIPLGA